MVFEDQLKAIMANGVVGACSPLDTDPQALNMNARVHANRPLSHG